MAPLCHRDRPAPEGTALRVEQDESDLRALRDLDVQVKRRLCQRRSGHTADTKFRTAPDLGGGETEPTELRDRLDPVSGGAVRDPPGRRRTVEQPTLTLEAIAPTDLRAQRTLTPTASDAAVSVQPSTTTNTAKRRLPLQLRAALR